MVLAQDPTGTDDNIEKKIERIAESTDAELDYTSLVEQMGYYAEHPINLNSATRDDLDDIIFLNDIQISNILEHIAKHGKLLMLNELQSIDGFDVETIRRITPYVKIDVSNMPSNINIKEVLKTGKSTLLIKYQQTLEQQKGYTPISDSAIQKSPNSHYLGSPQKLYARYNFAYSNKISFGFTAEKDAGEEFFKGTQKQGFDFYSAHYFMKGFGIVKALAIGDYEVQFGQGLTAYSGMSFGKSNDVMNIKKIPMGIKPYKSSLESKFLRGVATTIAIKKIEITGFFSYRFEDANVSSADTLTNQILAISSLQETGLHTTPGEIADKNTVDETTFGGNISYISNRLKVGVTAISTEFGRSLDRQLSPYSQFTFAGKRNSNIGCDYSYIYKNFNFFGEVARSENGSFGTVNGALISLDPRFAVSVVHRYYDKKYQALYSAGFSESSANANENGIFYGVVIRPFGYWTLSAYYDFFKFPWLKFQTDAPSAGNDALVDLNWKPNKKLELYMRYREETKSKNYTGTGAMIDYIRDYTKRSFRFHVSCKTSASITLKSRVEFINYKFADNKAEPGFLLYQDVIYNPIKFPLDVTFRYSIFDAKSYDARLYALEADAAPSSSIVSYSDSGLRTYVLLHYRINRYLDVWFRYGLFSYDKKNIIGSGLSEIQGNHRSEIKAQLRVKF